MTFRLLVNGEEVKSFDEQVTRVSLMTSRGVAGIVGIADEGSIDLLVEVAQPGGPMRLDHLENLQAQEARERSEGLAVGNAPQEVNKELLGSQGSPTYTAQSGGVEASSEKYVPPPSRDLTEGLESSDSGTRTARLNAYAASGDADAAIEDNPPGSGSEEAPAEEEAAPETETTEPTEPVITTEESSTEEADKKAADDEFSVQ